MIQIFINFIATLSAVALGFMLSLWHDRRKKARERNLAKLKVMESIKAELELNLQHLGEKGDPNHIVILRFVTVSKDSSVGSGDFMLLDLELQKVLSRIYNNFETAQMWTDKILSLAGTINMALLRDADRNIREFWGMAFAIHEALRRDIPKALEELGRRISGLRSELSVESL